MTYGVMNIGKLSRQTLTLRDLNTKKSVMLAL